MLIKIRQNLWIDLSKVTFAGMIGHSFQVKLENDEADYDFSDPSDVIMIESSLDRYYGYNQSLCSEPRG
jgi:hypothetical protein